MTDSDCLWNVFTLKKFVKQFLRPDGISVLPIWESVIFRICFAGLADGLVLCGQDVFSFMPGRGHGMHCTLSLSVLATR